MPPLDLKKVCSRLSNPPDPFEGLYQCPPFAELTQGATTKEIKDDTTAIYAAIAAVNAMLPVPEYTIRPWRAEKVESVWFSVPPEVRPRLRSVKVTEETGSVTGIGRGSGSGFRIQTVPKSAKILASINLAERPPQTKPAIKPALRAKTEGGDDEYSPQATLTAAEKPRTATIQGFAEENHGPHPSKVPTPALRRAPKRAVRAHSAANAPLPIYEEGDNENHSQPLTLTAKRAKRAQENLLMQRKMQDYFGPDGRYGAK